DTLPRDYLRRHPFARVPLLQDGDFELYETAAIAAYLDESFPQPPLQPTALHQRARLRQIVHAIDSYAYWPMVREVFVQRVLVPQRGGTADEAVIASGLTAARTALDAIERLAAPKGHLTGLQLTLADLHLAPMVYYFTQAPEGAAGFAEFGKLGRWWSAIKERPSVAEVCVPLEMS
ncbi:MAG: glutathione S-transferase family protein, partial [Kiloniellales bacterium]